MMITIVKKKFYFEPIRTIAAVSTAARRQAGLRTHTVHMVPRGGAKWFMLNKANTRTNIAAEVYEVTVLHNPAKM